MTTTIEARRHYNELYSVIRLIHTLQEVIDEGSESGFVQQQLRESLRDANSRFVQLALDTRYNRNVLTHLQHDVPAWSDRNMPYGLRHYWWFDSDNIELSIKAAKQWYPYSMTVFMMILFRNYGMGGRTTFTYKNQHTP